MAWDFISISAQANSATGNITLAAPDGAAQNDLLVACIGYRDSAAFTAPVGAGWTAVATQQSSGDTDQTQGIASGGMWYIVRGAENPSFVFTRTAGADAIGVVLCYRGVNTSAPYDTGNAATLASIAEPSLGTISTAEANELLVAMVSHGDESLTVTFDATDPGTASTTTDVVTDPTVGTWLERFDSTTSSGIDRGLAVADAVKSGAGATGTFSADAAVTTRSVFIVGAFKLSPVTVTTKHALSQHIAHQGKATITYLFDRIKHGITQTITPNLGIWIAFSSFIKHGISQHIAKIVAVTVQSAAENLTVALFHGVHQHISHLAKTSLAFTAVLKQAIHQHIAQRVGNISWHDPSSITMTKGAVVSGRLHDVYRGSDATEFVLSEVLGAYVDPSTGGGYTYDFEFGQFEDVIVLFLDLCITGYYKGNPAHVIKLQQYNYDSTTWINVTAAASDFISASSTQYYTFHLINSANYISSGNIKLRVIHSSNGVDSHFLYLDKFYIRAGTTSPRHSIHQHISVKVNSWLTYLWTKTRHAIHQHLASRAVINLTYLWTKVVDGIQLHIAHKVALTSEIILSVLHALTQQVGAKTNLLVSFVLNVRQAIHQSIGGVSTLLIQLWASVMAGVHYSISIKVQVARQVGLSWLGVEKFFTKAFKYLFKANYD